MPSPRTPSEAAAPGARTLRHGFFDDHPRFFETSETSPQPWRLNLRREAIFGEYRHLFTGARVLDIASHDGRWSFAALEAGASHVTGVEARPELVAEAQATLEHYGVDPGRYDFRTGDVFEVLREPVDADVVLCLGFFYHTIRYSELWTRMRQSAPRDILIDTLVEPNTTRSVIRLVSEPVARQGNAVPDEFSFGDEVLSGRPSRRALRLMGRAYGYRLDSATDWAALLRDNPTAEGVGDYRGGRRTTLHFVRADSS